MGVDRTDIDRQWRIVEEWLLSADARSAAVSEVRQLGLVGIDSDDLLSETSLRLWRSLDRREGAVDEGDDGRGLIRYARRTLRNAAVDSFRARRRRPEVLLDDLDLGAPGGTDRPDGAERLDSVLGSLATTTTEGDTAPGAKWLDDARRDLHAGLDRDAVAGAAALMALGVLADDLALDDVVAQPDRGAARIWPGLDEAARRALWEVVSDPATALAVDRLEHRGRIGLLADRIDSLVGRTGDPDLDVALRTLRSTDRRNRPGGARPVAATFDAPAGDDLAAGALAEGATEAVGLRVERVGDEVRATPPLGARPTAWVRVARREGRVLIAAAPVTSLLDGVVRLPVPATLPTRDLIVDVVDDPAVAVRSAAAGRVEQAVRAGRDAVTIARRRGWEPARERWGDCADHWDAAGDHLRAEQAAANATKPPVSRPFAHDRL